MSQIIQLFVTCIVDTLYPEVGEAVCAVLEKAGATITVPSGQTCCGQPAFNAGMRKEAARMAKQTICTFERAPWAVVVPSGSCAAMMRHSYLELFSDDPEWLARARQLAERTYELSEYLVDVLGILDLGASYQGKLTYHSSCHLLRELGVDRQPRALLANVRGAELVELPGSQECCGFGGVFSVEHPEISAEMLKRKMANIDASKAPRVVACDAGCITNINGGLRRSGRLQRAVHIAEILANQTEEVA